MSKKHDACERPPKRSVEARLRRGVRERPTVEIVSSGRRDDGTAHGEEDTSKRQPKQVGDGSGLLDRPRPDHQVCQADFQLVLKKRGLKHYLQRRQVAAEQVYRQAKLKSGTSELGIAVNRNRTAMGVDDIVRDRQADARS